MTADNRPIIAGIATHGLPLELVLRAVQADGPITSGVVLKTTQPETIRSRIATAVADVYGPQYQQGVAASSVCFSPMSDLIAALSVGESHFCLRCHSADQSCRGRSRRLESDGSPDETAAERVQPHRARRPRLEYSHARYRLNGSRRSRRRDPRDIGALRQPDCGPGNNQHVPTKAHLPAV